MKVIIKTAATQVKCDLGVKITQGGAGGIFPVNGHPEWVAKVYMIKNSDQINYQSALIERERLEAMLSRPPKINSPAFGTYHQLAWPVGILDDTNGRPLGFVMPRLHMDKACDLESLLTRDSRKIEGFSEDYRIRVYAARNLCALIREVHREGHYVVDIKPKNMSIYKPAAVKGLIAILDADGFSINSSSGRRFPAEMYSNEYIAPELLLNNLKPSNADEYQDRWALAVVIFRLLNNGIHPYQGIYKGSDSPTLDDNAKAGRYAYGLKIHKDIKPKIDSIHNYFDDDTRALFDRAFGSSRYDRPSAKEWRDHLQEFVSPNSKRILNCQTDQTHWHFSKSCPFCALNLLMSGGTARSRAVQVVVPTKKTITPSGGGTLKKQQSNNTNTLPRSQPIAQTASSTSATQYPPINSYPTNIRSSKNVTTYQTLNPPLKSDKGFKLKHLFMFLIFISLIYFFANREKQNTFSNSELIATTPLISSDTNEQMKSDELTKEMIQKFNAAITVKNLDDARETLNLLKSRTLQDGQLVSSEKQLQQLSDLYEELLLAISTDIRRGQFDESKTALAQLIKMSPSDSRLNLIGVELESKLASSSRTKVDSSNLSSTLRGLENTREP